jgi:hypothetical protein
MENKSMLDVSLQDNSAIVKYCGNWMAAEYQVKQLLVELEPLTGGEDIHLFEESQYLVD